MARYCLKLTRQAEKQLDSLPQKEHQWAVAAIRALAAEPRPTGCTKLKGTKDEYRIRVGAYRILYNVYDKELLVFVFRIAHRYCVAHWLPSAPQRSRWSLSVGHATQWRLF